MLLSPLAGQVALGDNIASFGLGKVRGYTQSGPGSEDVAASSYGFNVFATTTPGGTINAAKVYGPLNSYLDENNPKGPQDLSINGIGAGLAVTGYLNSGLLDTDFPPDSSGNYRLRVDVGALGGTIANLYDFEIPFNLGAGSYVTDVPRLTINNGAWQDATYVVSATDTGTSFGWVFSDFDPENPQDYVTLFRISPTQGGLDVVNEQFQGANPGGYTVPAGVLQGGTDYTVTLHFARIVDLPTVQGLSATGAAFYAVETSLALQAVPEPSTYALFGLGLTTVLFWSWRRRVAAKPRR